MSDLENDEVLLLNVQCSKVLLKANGGTAGGVRIYVHDMVVDRYFFYYLPYTHAREVMYDFDEGAEDVVWKRTRTRPEYTVSTSTVCRSGKSLAIAVEPLYLKDKERGRNYRRAQSVRYTPTVKHVDLDAESFRDEYTRFD